MTVGHLAFTSWFSYGGNLIGLQLIGNVLRKKITWKFEVCLCLATNRHRGINTPVELRGVVFSAIPFEVAAGY